MNRILWNNGRKVIDEIVIDHPDSVHIEQMSDNCWWIAIYLDDKSDGPCWMGNFICESKGRMRFLEQDNEGVIWDQDDEHGPIVGEDTDPYSNGTLVPDDHWGAGCPDDCDVHGGDDTDA